MESVGSREELPAASTAKLRHHQSLSLASDVDLLKCMQTLSQRIVSRANETLASLEVLERDATTAVIKVENCIQNLDLTSTKQFVEKRVYDDEVVDKKDEAQSASVTTTGKTQADFVSKIKEALILGLPPVRSKFSSQSAGTQMPRPLPYLLGSEEFIDSPTVGLPKPLEKPKRVEEPLPPQPALTRVNEPPSIESSRSPSPILIPQPAVKGPSPTPETAALPSREEPIQTAKAPSIATNLQEELAARLKIPAPASNHVPVGPSTVVPAQFPAAPKPMPRTFPEPVSKTRNLFDDTSSGTESDQDLFKPVAPNIKAPALVSSSTVPTPAAEPKPAAPNAPVTVKPSMNGAPGTAKNTGTLFGSSDSEDDLFGNIVKPLPVAPASQQPAAKVIRADEDDVDDLFSTRPKPPVSTLADKEASKQTVVSSGPVKKPAIQTKGSSLFADSDDEDDLFAGVSLPQPNKGLNVPVASRPASTSPRPDSPSQFQSTPVKQPMGNGTVSAVPVPAPAVTKEPIKKQNSGLFGDESDEDDLFGSIPAKPQQKKPDLFSGAPSTKDTPPPPAPSSAPILIEEQKAVKEHPASMATVNGRPQPPDPESGVIKAPSEPQPARNSVPALVVETKKPKSSLFADDDSDDEDLFAPVRKTASAKLAPTTSVTVQRVEIEKAKTPEPTPSVVENTSPVATAESKEVQKPPSIPEGTLVVPASKSSPVKVLPEPIFQQEAAPASVETPKSADHEQTAKPSAPTTNRIASLKLALSSQPNSLAFISPPGSATPSPLEGVGPPIVPTAGNAVRKPFGGVSIFGPPVANPVKTESERPVVDPTAAEADAGVESLPCLGRGRPRGPNNRRPQSRNFRRSQILDDQLEQIPGVANEDSRPAAPSPATEAPKEILKPAIKSTSLLDSESSDDDLFKPVAKPPDLKPLSKPAELPKRPASISSDDDELFKPNQKVDPQVTSQVSRDGSNGDLLKSTATVSSSGGGRVKAHAKINTTMPMSSDSDDGLFSVASGQAAAVATPGKSAVASSSLLVSSDSDDDLFSSVPKSRGLGPKPPLPAAPSSGESASKAARPSAKILDDPLLGLRD